MYTTVNEEGILNNYAPSLPIYYAEYPSQEQQRRYALSRCDLLFSRFKSLIADQALKAREERLYKLVY